MIEAASKVQARVAKAGHQRCQPKPSVQVDSARRPASIEGFWNTIRFGTEP